MMWYIAGIITCFKVLLIPSYNSTDFEVHRNWMSIAYNKPWYLWYIEDTSIWTIDYPPFFAFFEYILSNIASLYDENMLKISKTGYFSNNTLLFMRFSVIISDLVLIYGVQRISKCLINKGANNQQNWSKINLDSPITIFQILILCNVGLIMLDHIHFQYNGFLFGMLLISISDVLMEQYYWSAFWYIVLLNFKHIFIYMGPMFFIYFLRNYCIVTIRGKIELNIKRLATLVAIVLGVTLISFGPYIVSGQLFQVLRRLFPFKRGLTHAYWAPNIWALYNFTDRILCVLALKFGYTTNCKVGHLTGGIVTVSDHAVLPVITPTTTLVLTILAIIPCSIKLWKSPNNKPQFLRSIVIGTATAYLFGWHVHEKAVLMVIIPLSILAVLTRKDAKCYILLSIVGNFSLLPLLFTTNEIFLKYLLFLLQTWYTISSLSKYHYQNMLTFRQNMYLLGFLAVIILEIRGFFNNNYPFLPLMVTSVYCSFGMIYIYLMYYKQFLRVPVKDTRITVK